MARRASCELRERARFLTRSHYENGDVGYLLFGVISCPRGKLCRGLARNRRRRVVPKNGGLPTLIVDVLRLN
jgi:hypothetical protein